MQPPRKKATTSIASFEYPDRIQVCLHCFLLAYCSALLSRIWRKIWNFERHRRRHRLVSLWENQRMSTRCSISTESDSASDFTEEVPRPKTELVFVLNKRGDFVTSRGNIEQGNSLFEQLAEGAYRGAGAALEQYFDFGKVDAAEFGFIDSEVFEEVGFDFREANRGIAKKQGIEQGFGGTGDAVVSDAVCGLILSAWYEISFGKVRILKYSDWRPVAFVSAGGD